jgi:protein TonB
MLYRYPATAFAAAAITFGLFLTMQALVASRPVEMQESGPRHRLEFVRLKRSENLDLKKREKPQKIDKTAPDAPAPAAPQSSQSDAGASAVGVAAATASLGFGDGSSGGAGVADADVIPLVRVNPQYPAKAAASGIEGWVHVRFTITPQGTTSEIAVVKAEPPGYFEGAATAAVKGYKYKPKIENGQAVERPGVELVLAFKLDQ